MKITFFCMPYYGHINPNLELIKLLAERKVEVLVFAASKFRKLIEREHVQLEEYPDEIMHFLTSVASNFQEDSNAAAHYYAYLTDNVIINDRNLVINELSMRFCELYYEKIQEFSPDIIFCDSQANFVGHILDKLKKPVIRLNCSTYMPAYSKSSDFQRFYDEIIRSVCEFQVTYDQVLAINRKGQSRTRRNKKRNDLSYPIYHFAYISPLLQREKELLIEDVNYMGMSVTKKLDCEKKNCLYIFRGTISDEYNYSLLYDTLSCMKEIKMEKRVSAGGNERIIEKLGHQAETIYLQFADQLKELSEAKIFVTHGGITGVKEALFCGTPMIVIPANFPDYQTGLALEENGAGILIRKRPISKEQMEHAVKEILEHYEKYSLGVEKMASEMLVCWKKSGTESIIEQCYKIIDTKI